MGESESGGGAGCAMNLILVMVIFGLVAWAFGGLEPEEAARFGVTWGALVCGGLTLLVVALAVFVGVQDARGWR